MISKTQKLFSSKLPLLIFVFFIVDFYDIITILEKHFRDKLHLNGKNCRIGFEKLFNFFLVILVIFDQYNNNTLFSLKFLNF